MSTSHFVFENEVFLQVCFRDWIHGLKEHKSYRYKMTRACLWNFAYGVSVIENGYARQKHLDYIALCAWWPGMIF